MKKFFLSIVALAAIFSCTKSELVNAPGAGTPIAFETYSGRIPTTKATSVVGQEGLAQAGGFQVYAFIHAHEANASYETPYMNKVVTGTLNEATETTEASVSWGYDGITYWPTTHELDFVAYALNCNTAVVADETDKYTKINYTVADAVADQTDLLDATPDYNATSAGGDAVHLTFNHMLSRVGFSLVTNQGNAVLVTVEDVTLTGQFSKTGSVVLNAKNAEGAAVVPAITADTATEVTYDLLGDGTYTSAGSVDGTPIFNNGMLYTKDTNNTESIYDDKYVAKAEPTAEETAAAAANENNRHMMIIPTTAHNAKLYVKYALPEAGESFVVADIDIKDIQFLPGFSYEFRFKVSTNAVGFTVEVQPWDPAGNAGEIIQLS